MDAQPRILVVDDVAQNVRLLEAVLGANGYSVSPATSGTEAFERVAAEPPDLVLLDVQMPGMNGYDVCRKLRQVVFNLLSNAVKFTPAGGRVDVSAQLTDGIVEVAVADTGPGIAREEQELIFEEFRQARGDPGKRHEGTGLGLALSRRFVELHGGRLWVESVQGEGSTFRFTLPVEQSG